MRLKTSHLHITLLITLGFLYLQDPSKILAEAGGESTFNSFEYKNFVFELDPGCNVKKLAKRINLRRIPGLQGMRESGLKSPDPAKRFGAKVAILYHRVQVILNMYPRNKKKLVFRVYNRFKDLKAQAKQFGRGHNKAFYHIKENAIFFASDNINEFILAHEMAHAIIEQYFIVHPPANVQEILAIHCDTHLKDANVG